MAGLDAVTDTPTTTAAHVEHHECDVAVVGSGAAGLSAALAASACGDRVVVLEKSDRLGGATAMSGGCVWVPNNHHMAAVGANDSADEALAYIRAASPEGWHNVEDPLWVAFVTQAPTMLRFLEARSPLRFSANLEPDPYAEVAGSKTRGRNVSPRPLPSSILGPWRHAVRAPTLVLDLNYEELVDTCLLAHPKRWMLRFAPRVAWRKLTGRRTRGNALVIGLLRGCLDHGCELWVETLAERLNRGDGGAVSGLELRRDGRRVHLDAHKGVVLASGGFEWNAQMMRQHFPGPVEWTASPRSNTGDGQRMAQAVGAKLDRMDQALIMGSTPILYEGQLQGLPAADYYLPHSMIVNRRGKRFVNEKQPAIGLAFIERDPGSRHPVHLPAWRIYDRQFASKYPHALPSRKFPGVRYRDQTLAGLARQIDVDAQALVETARRFSAFARCGVDEDFGRGASIWDQTRLGDPDHRPSRTLGTIEAPPFYAMPFKPSFLATKGGARTNERGQVLDREDRVIPRLYAAGNVMANPFGSKGLGAGTTLGPCLTWGYVCGNNVSQG